MNPVFKSAYRKYLSAVRHGWSTSSFTAGGMYLVHKNGRGRVFHLSFEGTILTIPF